MSRTIQYLIPTENVPMGHVIVGQALPTQRIRQVDPFLLLHHAVFEFDDLSPALHQGLGPHPHRGFTPVTFVIDGEVHHRDSRGNSQIAKRGEVQWMHAGAGIIHSERPSEDLAQANGGHEIIQLWINSPSASKMKIPTYQYIPQADIPWFTNESDHVSNKLVAGNYQNLKGEIATESELLVLWSQTKTTTGDFDGQQIWEVPPHMNAMIYMIKGEMRLHGYGMVEKKQLVVLENDSDKIEATLLPGSELLVLAGAPHNEKVVQQGPFVMNSETQILEAIRDYQKGKMGVLIEE